jgi:hypothetical protein
MLLLPFLTVAWQQQHAWVTAGPGPQLTGTSAVLTEQAGL